MLRVAAPTEPGGPTGHRPPPPPLEAVQAAFTQLEIVELIGQGGMGAVFKARQPKLNRFVALKILPEVLARDPAFAERFAREGQMLARLNHPNVVTVHDFGQANGFFYLLMEYVDGVNLRQAMQAGRFTPEQALAIVPMICDALQYAHDEGVLHRDIKPENILLDTKGRVRLVDFGVAKLATCSEGVPDTPEAAQESELALTQAGSALGTPSYMAPEQRDSPATVDQRADIYSLGVVFYEMLTGELPAGRFAPPSQKTPLDPRVDDVVLRALAKQKEKRFGSAAEVRTSLQTLADSVPGAPKAAGGIPLAAQGHPIPLSPGFRSALGLGLLILFGLMVNQMVPAIGRILTSLWSTLQAGWVQGIVVATGIGGITCLGSWVWRRRDWFMASVQSAAPLPAAADSGPGKEAQQREDQWLPVAWLGIIGALLVEVIWILLGQTMMVAQWLAMRDFLPSVYVVLTTGFWVLLPMLLVRRELRRTDVLAPSAPPSWMPRAALLAVAFAVITSLPMPRSHLPTFHISFGAFMVVLALAMVTRSRLWRAVALALMMQMMVLGLIGLTVFVLAAGWGQLEGEWSVSAGPVDAKALAIIIQLVTLSCYGAGLITLLHPATEVAFGLRRARVDAASAPLNHTRE